VLGVLLGNNWRHHQQEKQQTGQRKAHITFP
jgi:hypothetical protein